MQKEIYILRGTSAESYASFQERIQSLADRLIRETAPEKLSVTLTTEKPPRMTVIPFVSKKIAALSLYRETNGPVNSLKTEPDLCGAYRVEEAMPVQYEKSWSNGEITPGICLLTLFRRRPGLDHATFLHRWHHSHTPLSLRIHPLWHYNRNVVTGTLDPGSEPWEGIVEEHMKSRADLLNPFRFFGNPMVIVQRMVEVYRDTRSFLDYKTIEPYLVREYHIK